MVLNLVRLKSKLTPEQAARVPPGQAVMDKWPVLHCGDIPHISQDKWTLRVFGLIDQEPFAIGWQQLMALPQRVMTVDIHCVTRWSRLDVTFEGVLFSDVMSLVKPNPRATHVMIHAEGNFTTNLCLGDLRSPNVMLAHRAEGKDLEPEHGGPVRLVVPHRYFWKSAKWVRGVEFMDRDRAGFWESSGYHVRADPWREERFSD